MENKLKTNTQSLIEFLRPGTEVHDPIEREKRAKERLDQMESPLAIEVLSKSYEHDSNDKQMTYSKIKERFSSLSKFLDRKNLQKKDFAALRERSAISFYRSERSANAQGQKCDSIDILFMFAPDSAEAQNEFRLARLSQHNKIIRSCLEGR